MKIPISGTVPERKKQIDDFFRKNNPDHFRTSEGHLVFETTFDPADKTALKDFTGLELNAVIKAYALPAPSVFANKHSTYKHVKKHLLKKYPAAEIINDDIVFTTERRETPESKTRIKHLRGTKTTKSQE